MYLGRIRVLMGAACLALLGQVLPSGAGVAHAAAPVAGDLVKLADDHDPATETDRAVYYVGVNQKRYVFPTLQTYLSWYPDFSTVKTVAGEELAALPIGGNVTYRPGTRLVKIQTDPKVYAVEPNGKLRGIKDEAVAVALWGADWNKRVDDVPDTFFTDYRIASTLDSARYTDGSLVKRTSDGAYFLISDDAKRRLAGKPAAFGFNEAFAITTAGNLSDYADGLPLNAPEAALSDAAQLPPEFSLPPVPTFSTFALPTDALAIGGSSAVFALRVVTPVPVTLKQLAFRVEATSKTGPGTTATDPYRRYLPGNPTTNSVSTSGTTDDAGGLVYRNLSQPNLTAFRVTDVAGITVLGSRELVADPNQDRSQTLFFTGDLEIPIGESRLWLRADGSENIPVGETYRITLASGGTQLQDASGAPLSDLQPRTDITGPTLTAKSIVLAILPESGISKRAFVRGTKDAELGSFTLQAPLLPGSLLEDVTLQGYLDEEGNGSFGAGTDLDMGVHGTVSGLVSQLYLCDQAGKHLAGPVQVTGDGQAKFDGLGIALGSGSTVQFTLRGDLNPNADLDSQPDLLAFDVVNAADVKVMDANGERIIAKGGAPNGGIKPVSFATIKERGKITFSWTGNTSEVISDSSAPLGTLSIKAEEDGYRIDKLAFQRTDAFVPPPGKATLVMPAGSTQTTVTSDFMNNQVVFEDLGLIVERDKKVDMTLRFDAGQVQTESYGKILKLKFLPTGLLEFRSLSNASVYDSSDLGSAGFTINPNTESALTMHYTNLAFVNDNVPASGATVHPDAQSTVLSFEAKVGPGGGARLKKLTFKLTPSDVGVTGSDNDSLERWAELNGDFEDDNLVADLVIISPDNTKSVIGEDASANIRYAIVRSGQKSSASSTLDSKTGDYAVLEFIFTPGNEFFIGSNGDIHFRLDLDTAEFDLSADRTLKVELLGGADLIWTDVPSGNYRPRNDAAGFPITSTLKIPKS